MAHNHQIHKERGESHRLEDVRKKKNKCKKFTKVEPEHNFKRSYEIFIKAYLSKYIRKMEIPIAYLVEYSCKVYLLFYLFLIITTFTSFSFLEYYMSILIVTSMVQIFSPLNHFFQGGRELL